MDSNISIIADALNPTNPLDWIQNAGIIGLLLFAFISLMRKWLVFGWQYKELLDRLDKVEKQNARWMELALRSTNLAESLNELNRTQGL